MAAAYAIESLGLSERRACLLTGISPSVYRYKSKQGDDAVLRRRMRELAWERKRFGSPRLHIMLKREGLVINHKRTERIYSEEGLALRKKRRRKGAAGVRETIPSPVRPNQRWSMDFVSDSTVTGRRFRALAIEEDGLHRPVGTAVVHAVHGSKALLVNQGERLVSENLGPTSLQTLSLLRRHQELGLPEALLRVSYSEHPPLPRPGAAPTPFPHIILPLPPEDEGFLRTNQGCA